MVKFTRDTETAYCIELEDQAGKRFLLGIRTRRPDYLEVEVIEGWTALPSSGPGELRPIVAREIYTLRDLLFYDRDGEI